MIDPATRAYVDEKVERVYIRLDALETTLTGRMGALETAITGRMDALETRMQSLETGLTHRMAGLESKMDAVLAIVPFITQAYHQLQDAYERLQADYRRDYGVVLEQLKHIRNKLEGSSMGFGKPETA